MQVALTRPYDDSVRTAAALKNKGFDAIISPVLQIKRLEYTLPGNIVGMTGILTSANALFAAPNEMAYWVVGANLAQMLTSAGIEVAKVFPNVASLAAEGINSSNRFLHISGENIALEIAKLLPAGRYQRVIVYRAEPVEFLDKVKILSADVVTLYSVRSAKVFFSLVSCQEMQEFLDRIIYVTLSDNIRDLVVSLGFSKVYAASSPSEIALIELLESVNENFFQKSKKDS